jgi:two-component system, NarL family, nitrate/nitrite response regulator NarL
MVVYFSARTMNHEPFGTVLVGRNALMREGVARILSTDFRILASAACVGDLVVTSLPKGESFLIIVDVSDDFYAEIEQIACFKKQNQTAHIVLLAHERRLSEMMSAFHAGANAYFLKIPTCEIFIKSLEVVMLGVTILPPELVAFIFDHQNRSENSGQNSDEEANGNSHQHDHDDDAKDDDVEDNNEEAGVAGRPETYINPRLSARQKMILRCLLDGNSNKTIARRIAIAEGTVKVHIKTILRKIRVCNRTQAAIWAMSQDSILSTNKPSSATAKLPVQHGLTMDHGLFERRHKSALSSALKLEGEKHVALASVDRLGPKGISTKND